MSLKPYSVRSCLAFLVLLIVGCKDDTLPPNQFMDKFGNIHTTVTIGSQVWMAENLDLAYFSNGDPIPRAITPEQWQQANQNQQPAWRFSDPYDELTRYPGKYYNWYAVTDPRGLAPDGWAIPSTNDWKELSEFLGTENAGTILKSRYGWPLDNEGTDEFGFRALPGSMLESHGRLSYGSSGAYWWTSSMPAPPQEGLADSAEIRLGSTRLTIDLIILSYGNGFNVRCIKE